MKKLPLPSGIPEGFLPGKNDWRPTILVLAFSILAALLMPKNSPFPFVYEAGAVWNYKNLKSPLDYEVLRPENEVADKLADIEATHGPYFIFNAETPRNQKKKFAQLVDKQTDISKNDTQYADLVANPGQYVAYGQSLLDKIYSRGIALPGEGFREAGAGNMVWLQQGKEAKRVPFAEVFSPKTARDFLTDSLPFSPLRQPELILGLLEKSLAPNVVFSDSLTLLAKRARISEVLSTGIYVRKGEKIVSKGEIVSPEIKMKLDSLSSRFEQPKGFAVFFGHALAAFLAFSIFAFGLKTREPEIWQQPRKLLLAPTAILAALALVNLALKVGAAVPLLLPIFILPVLISRFTDAKTGLLAWLLAIFLSAYALEWGLAWLLVQGIGGFVAWLALPMAKSFRARFFAVFIIAGSMVLAWAASYFADRLPESLQLADVPFFLLAAAVLGLLVFPAIRFLNQFFEKPTATNLPVKT